MQDNRTDRALALVADPASPRLDAATVVEINRLHLSGVGWDTIAERAHTTRKNVQRIVQGRRWRQVHPSVRPDLYTDAPEDTVADDGLEAIIDGALRDARDRIIKELRAAT